MGFRDEYIHLFAFLLLQAQHIEYLHFMYFLDYLFAFCVAVAGVDEAKLLLEVKFRISRRMSIALLWAYDVSGQAKDVEGM
jgi:hypothetical protein